jgi:Spy/CpxP family protein refolding chaperone
MMGGMGLLRSFHELNLSAAQQQQLHTILSNARAQAETKRPGGASDMMALANPGDPNYAAAVQAAKKRAADRIQKASDLKLQLYNVLTPDQKTQLSKRMADWKARMAQRADGPKGQPAPANR